MATLRERLSSAAFGAGWSLVCRLPESVARALFNFGADTAWRKQGGGVRVLEGNLLRIFRTDPAYSPGVQPDGSYVDEGKELRTLSREVMRSYARYYLETFRMQVIPAERIASGMHVNFDQADLTLEYMKNGRGVIFALPHMGDFELTGKWIIGYGAGSFTTVAERLKPDAVFQMFLDFRQGLGMEVLPTTGGPHPFGVMAQRLRAGKLVCLVADRDLSDTGVEVDFFGEKALFPAGPASLAIQTGAALMPVACWFEGEDEWGAHIYDEIPVPADGTRKEKAAAMTQAMATVFEEGIREHPEDWHMLQQVFVNDLDPERLARSRNRPVNGNGTTPASATLSKRRRGLAVKRRRGRAVRIGIACPYSWDVPGGVQQHIRDLAEALIGMGHEVSVIAPADEDRPLPGYVVPTGRAMPVPYNGSVARLSFGPLSANRVRRWLRDGDFDVLHVHEPTVPSLPLLACWVASGPIVATVHTAMPKSRVLLATQPVLRTALEKIDARIAVSEAARTTFVEHLGGDAVLIPNGVATHRYRAREPARRAGRGPAA